MSKSKPFAFFVIILFFDPAFGISGSFYADNGRQQSVLYKTLGKREKTNLQEEILNLLGMDHRPKRRNRPQKLDILNSSAEKYLLDLYQKIEDGNIEKAGVCSNSSSCEPLDDSDFIVSFPNKIHHHYPHLRHERDRRFYFDVEKIPAEEEIVKAELRIFRNVTKRSQSSKMQNYVLQLFAVAKDIYDANSLDLVDELTISGDDHEDWIVFNVTGPVMNWIAFPKKNLGLYLKIKVLAYSQAKGHYVDPHEVGILSSKAPDEYKAFMVAYFKTPSHARVRATRAAKKKSHESYYEHAGYNPYTAQKDRYNSKARSCERWTLYVSFRDLGFEDWIIAPDGYAAFYCDGSCTFPLNAHSNATNHAIVQTLMHLMEPSKVPKPCCAPTQLTAITVLYFDDNSNVILKKYKNMVVKSCGCH